MMAIQVLDISSLPSGRKWELQVLGFTVADREFARPMQYHEFDSYLMQVMLHQPVNYNPRCPRSGMTSELYDSVRNYLPKKWRKFLSLYIALGLGLDRVHGVDAFFYLNGVSVTLDLTTNTS